MSPKEFNELRTEFLTKNVTGAARLQMITQLDNYQRKLIQQQDREAKLEAASAITYAAQRLTTNSQYIPVDIANTAISVALERRREYDDALVLQERERCIEIVNRELDCSGHAQAIEIEIRNAI